MAEIKNGRRVTFRSVQPCMNSIVGHICGQLIHIIAVNEANVCTSEHVCLQGARSESKANVMF